MQIFFERKVTFAHKAQADKKEDRRPIPHNISFRNTNWYNLFLTFRKYPDTAKDVYKLFLMLSSMSLLASFLLRGIK